MHLEHINLTVNDLDRSIRFYQHLLGLDLRWQGETSAGEPAAHLGGTTSYLALFQAAKPEVLAAPDYGRTGLNHFGVLVEDLPACRDRLVELGIQPHFEPEYQPGQRLYFYDPDGIEVELVSYAAAPTPSGSGQH